MMQRQDIAWVIVSSAQPIQWTQSRAIFLRLLDQAADGIKDFKVTI